MKEEKAPPTKRENSVRQTFVEGVDYYFENGLMILTARFLSQRGFCCGNGCRNCPYPKTASE